MVCVSACNWCMCACAGGGEGLRVWVRAYVFACSYVCVCLYVR